MLETSDKDVHEELLVPLSLTTEDFQSWFADSSAHIPEMKKIRSPGIAGASHFAHTAIKDVELRSNNSNYSVILLPNEQQRCRRADEDLKHCVVGIAVGRQHAEFGPGDIGPTRALEWGAIQSARSTA